MLCPNLAKLFPKKIPKFKKNKKIFVKEISMKLGIFGIILIK